MAPAQTNKDVVQRTFDTLNRRDRDAFVDLHADAAVAYVGDETFHGSKEIATDQFAYFDAFPDLTYTPHTVIAEDDTVAARWTFAGTHAGEFQGIDPTGAEVEIPVMGLFRIEDEHIDEVWLLPDRLALMQQLGVVTLPAKGEYGMSTEKSKTDTTYEATLNEHYGVTDLGDEILNALEAAGKDIDALTRDDIASFDEFHIRGREATREVADLAEVEDHSRVLDVGCGIGGPARTLASEFGCDVVGIDIVEEYCRAATLFTDQVGLTDKVRFQHGNALDLPFEDEEFDVVWFEHTLVNIEAAGVAFGEAGRILRPGGTLALYEICAGPGGEPVFPVPWASDASLSYLDPPGRLREIVLDRGFNEVAWRDVTALSLEWFRDMVESMQSRPADAPPPLGLNLLMGAETPIKAANVVQNLEEDQIAVVQAVYERVS